jgi:hypothetical protein
VKDFFISYNSNDHSWAVWLAWQLEEAGYTTILKAWDFRPGSNFIQRMQEAATDAKRTIAVLSPDYLASIYTQSEWQAAFNQDPMGEKGIFLPVRVREVELTGLLKQIVYIDLVALNESAAREAILNGVRSMRTKPQTPPSFPQGAGHTVNQPTIYPGEQDIASPTERKLSHKKKAGRCRPFSVNLTVLRLEKGQQISVSLIKGCTPNDTAFYSFTFVIRRSHGAEWLEEVNLKVTVGEDMTERAQKLMDSGLSQSQLAWIQGPIATRAKELADGTENDLRLSNLTERMLTL